MDYYQCAVDDLHIEIRRRGCIPIGTKDQLSEALQEDDSRRGADATTISTRELETVMPRQIILSRTAEFGQTVPAGLLVNERILFWTMNTFFPTLQFFFASGRSCTIDSGRLSDGVVGLDPDLRFRLTECTYEEEGCITKTLRPEKFARSYRGIKIKEAVVAQRTSVATKLSISGTDAPSTPICAATIGQETHTVVGLKLEGMSKMSYIWAKARNPSIPSDRTWGDARIAGLRDDVLKPILTLPLHTVKPGGQVRVVTSTSLVSRNALHDSKQDASIQHCR